jgi:hypothetical protein
MNHGPPDPNKSTPDLATNSQGNSQTHAVTVAAIQPQPAPAPPQPAK